MRIMQTQLSTVVVVEVEVEVEAELCKNSGPLTVLPVNRLNGDRLPC